jgi:hypothetical protein
MPVTPQITVTGTLADIFGSALTKGTLVFMLCGYGPFIPRIAGTAFIAQTAPKKKAVDGAGAFSITLWGNDVITPLGTFYTVQLLDDNGNVIQTNAYRFTGAGTIDLSTVGPFAPYVPPVPPAPSPSALYVIVNWGATPDFNALGTEGIVTFDMILSGNVIMPTFSNLTPGQIVTLILQQNGVGGWTFAAPATMFGLGVINTDPNVINRQSFVVRGDGNLYNITPMSND